MPFEQPGGSFPGSAYYYLASDSDPAPARDGTFRSAISSLIPGSHWDGEAAPADDQPGDGLTTPGPAARALAQMGSAEDKARALQCLTAAIYYESASEPDGGQRAVAQVVLNRVAHPSFPNTVCGVVFQGSERNTGCQFSFTCDGALMRKPSRYFWDRAQKVAQAALAGYVYRPVGLATHYHTFAVHPYWADSLNFIGQIGAHRFYTMRGPAGTPAAFRVNYTGIEPLAVAHARNSRPDPQDLADPLAQERAYEASLRLTAAPRGTVPAPVAAAPAYTSDVIRHGGDAAYRARALPGTEAVRPEYQDSGRWIGSPQ
ncbi:cell wall hydrolase [Novosphingobium sp. FSY-8]|uniref:Cell wall hydrolase n=2 Tax=Novosphingobium ovatum TaxID=1908523 RepID=A0ABW9X9X5_9SPHN|nr:cell wall hydrolase [Novosphingobium ovatum]